MELRPKPIVRPRTHSLDQSLPYLGELMQHGQITLGNVRPVGCVAVAHDGRQTVAMLLRREGETVTQLLSQPDQPAILPHKITVHFWISRWTLQNRTPLSTRSQANAYFRTASLRSLYR